MSANNAFQLITACPSSTSMATCGKWSGDCTTTYVCSGAQRFGCTNSAGHIQTVTCCKPGTLTCTVLQVVSTGPSCTVENSTSPYSPVLQVTDIACKFFKPAGNCILSDKITATCIVSTAAEYDPDVNSVRDPLKTDEPYTGPCSYDKEYAAEMGWPICGHLVDPTDEESFLE